MISTFSRALETSNYFVENYKNIESTTYSSQLIEYTPPKKNLSQHNIQNGLKHDDEWRDFKDRVIKFCDSIFDKPPQSPMIIFGHSMFISCVVSYISSNRLFFPQKTELSFRLPNCSITTFTYDESHNSWCVDCVGSIAHLPKDMITGTHNPFANRIEI